MATSSDPSIREQNEPMLSDTSRYISWRERNPITGTTASSSMPKSHVPLTLLPRRVFFLTTFRDSSQLRLSPPQCREGSMLSASYTTCVWLFCSQDTTPAISYASAMGCPKSSPMLLGRRSWRACHLPPVEPAWLYRVPSAQLHISG
jgi:hypothetical protein